LPFWANDHAVPAVVGGDVQINLRKPLSADGFSLLGAFKGPHWIIQLRSSFFSAAFSALLPQGLPALAACGRAAARYWYALASAADRYGWFAAVCFGCCCCRLRLLDARLLLHGLLLGLRPLLLLRCCCRDAKR
jgi:hypothetical protein